MPQEMKRMQKYTTWTQSVKWIVKMQSMYSHECIYISIAYHKYPLFWCLTIIYKCYFQFLTKIHGTVNYFLFFCHVEVMVTQTVSWIVRGHCVLLTTSASITSDQKFRSSTMSKKFHFKTKYCVIYIKETATYNTQNTLTKRIIG